ncbi:MAG: hypothetical protein PHU47_00385 [Candidatus ainarchaeum sp.]|jgi:hypothetical protein|nr:hypothetical protein [Candidatus ainarchaeum sp.]
MTIQRLGAYAFLIGILFSIVFAIFPSLTGVTWVTLILLLLGILIGLLNIEDKDIIPFLLAAIVLIATSATPLGTLPLVGAFLHRVVVNFVSFVSPAALIVSIVAILRIANSK